MQKRSRTVQQRYERQSHGSVLLRLAAKLRGQTPPQKFEGRHVLFAREGHSPIFRDEAEIVGMGSKEVEDAAARLRCVPRGFDSREEIQPGAAPQKN